MIRLNLLLRKSPLPVSLPPWVMEAAGSYPYSKKLEKREMFHVKHFCPPMPLRRLPPPAYSRGHARQAWAVTKGCRMEMKKPVFSYG